MDERLSEAARNGNIAALYALIRQDARILECLDGLPFVDTPLHTAASTGQTLFAMEVIGLRPSLGRKLNQDGYSPLHLALHHQQVWLAERLVFCDRELVRFKGLHGITPLHYVVITENMRLLKTFLLACPESVEEVTNRMESPLHLAVRFHKLDALKFLAKWLRHAGKEKVLSWPDEDGNTVLHIATSSNEYEIVEFLLSKKIVKKINKNGINRKGKTALDVFDLFTEFGSQRIRELLVGAGVKKASSVKTLSFGDYTDGKKPVHETIERYLGLNNRPKLSPGELNQMVLVVAVLIATATFQAALQPPGGFPNDDEHYNPNQRMGVVPLVIFICSNSIAFFASIGTIRTLTVGLGYNLLQYSLLFLCSAYSFLLMMLIRVSIGLIIVLFLFLILVTLFLFVGARKLVRITPKILRRYMIKKRQLDAFHRMLA